MVVDQNYVANIPVQSPGADIMLKRPNDQAIKLYKVCSVKHDRRQEGVTMSVCLSSPLRRVPSEPS